MISQIEKVNLNDVEVLATSRLESSNGITDTYECIYSYNGKVGHFDYYIEKGAKDNLLDALIDFCDDVIDYMNDPENALDVQEERAEGFAFVFGNDRNKAVQLQHSYERVFSDRKRIEDLRSMEFSSEYNKLYCSAVKHIYDAIVQSGLCVDSDDIIDGVELCYFDKNRFEVNMIYILNGKLMFITDKNEKDLEFGKEITKMDIKQLFMIADNIYEIIDNVKNALV